MIIIQLPMEPGVLHTLTISSWIGLNATSSAQSYWIGPPTQLHCIQLQGSLLPLPYAITSYTTPRLPMLN
jgi:hypothetical protein